MLARIDLRGDRSGPVPRLPRASPETVASARRAAGEVVDAVRAEGDAAVARFAERFDGWSGGPLEVPRAEARSALAALDPALRAALERAVDQVRWFHERSRPQDWREERGGAVLGVVHRPLRRVGVYVPGGRAVYPSTVVMTVVPARVAGVDEVVLCTPPDRDGRVNATVLAAAALTGADRILRVGGAQAVAAMAYGTASVPRCDKVVGPGNVYVAEAKQRVAADGACGIDALAGVTEVAVIADAAADPGLVAADLVAQAEHDPLAACLLITPSEELAAAVDAALEEEVAATRHMDRVRQALAGQGAVALVDDLDHAVEVADAFAPEHLEVQTADAAAVAAGVRAAGAIFVGADSPVSLGDYCAGPNHTLPTGGTARFTGGLRTDDFLVPINWVEYSRVALAALEPVVAALGEAENLPAHVRAVRARLEPGR
ncbi:MAG: histidinol dehydrogenase [Euzebyaceae bacterium]|jgi:histidinol dehydrogenase|nr:histidinol dehydrogenase [Euzebyaceae bacterium]